MGGEALGARKKTSQVPFDDHAKRKGISLVLGLPKSQNENKKV